MEGPLSRLVERRARRMQDMMQRLDVDAAKLVRRDAGQAYAEARARCLGCDTARECLFWLSTETGLGVAPDFCANSELFETCRKEHGQSGEPDS